MRMSPALPIIVATIGPILALPGSPAAASCAQDPGPDGSPVVFVGTADGARGGFTRFVVDEVWEGPDLAPEVWVLSGQEQPSFPFNLVTAVSSSTDASFVDGATYLVGASADFGTDACSSREFSETTDRAAAPDDLRGPVDDGTTGADPPVSPAVQAVLALGVLTLLGLAIQRWRRRRAT